MDFILIILFAVFVIFTVLLGAPLFAVLGGLGLILFTSINISTNAIIVEICRLGNAPEIIALPLFTFTGYVLAESKASDRLIKMSESFLSWLPGGLGVVVLVAGAIFTALTGANSLGIIALGGILLPALLKSGYDERLALGLVTASGGSTGILFIPSLAIIIYSLISRTDTVQLFIAGIVPGILLVGVLVIYAIMAGIKNKIPTSPTSIKKMLTAANDAKWEIPLPFVIIGGIFYGIITVDEAAATSAFYVIVTECFIYREIGFKKLMKVIIESMIMVGALLIILGVALGLTNYLIDQHIPQRVMAFLQLHISSKIGFLLALNVFLLVVGCMMDIYSAIVVIVPLLAPVAYGYGIDPIHLGVIFLSNLTIGYLTPPIGMDLFVASMRFNEPVAKIFRAVIPLLIILIFALLIITYCEYLSLFLIDLLGKRPPLIQL